MKQSEVKRKLVVLNQQGIQWVLADILLLIDCEINGECPESNEDYALLVKEVVKTMKARYKEQLEGHVVASKQRDLEELIQSIKEGKE